MECQDVMRDSLQRIREAAERNGKASDAGRILHVRINPDFPLISWENEADCGHDQVARNLYRANSIPMRGTALNVLESIEKVMTKLDRD